MKEGVFLNILLTGGTGFIGSRFVKRLVAEGHHVYVLTRFPKQHQDTEYVSYISYNYSMNRLPFIHAVVNLAGESLFGYWSEKKKADVVSSRIQTTEKLIAIMMHMETKPEVFISGSAIGYYGVSNDKIFTEATKEASDDFLATVTSQWENVAHTAEDFGIRTVYARFGVVLDENEGALPQMARPIKLFAGGKIGSGEQWISWIHIDDCVEMLLFALQEKAIKGPLNVTAPYPRRNADFTKVLGQTLHRPTFLSAPTAMLKIMLGEMHQLITEGQYVYPKKAEENHFTFTYPHLEEALQQIYQ